MVEVLERRTTRRRGVKLNLIHETPVCLVLSLRSPKKDHKITMEATTVVGASTALLDTAIAPRVPTSISDLPSEIVAEISELLASGKLFSSLLERRLTNEAIGAEAARVLVLRAERRVWTVLESDVGDWTKPVLMGIFIDYKEAQQRYRLFMGLEVDATDKEVEEARRRSLDYNGTAPWIVESYVKGIAKRSNFVWVASEFGPARSREEELKLVGVFISQTEAIETSRTIQPHRKRLIATRRVEGRGT